MVVGHIAAARIAAGVVGSECGQSMRGPTRVTAAVGSLDAAAAEFNKSGV
jgi:hypothetical protein